MTHRGFLRPLPPAYLLQLLPAVLSALPLPARLAHPDRAAAKKPLQQQKGKNTKASDVAVAAADPLRVDADEQDVLDALDAVECSDEEIARQVLAFFGTREDGSGKKRSKWDLDALALVKELGIVLLAQGGVRTRIPFLARLVLLMRPCETDTSPHVLAQTSLASNLRARFSKSGNRSREGSPPCAS